MTFFTASIQTVVLRYYAMMAVIVITFAMGYPLLTFLGFPIFLAAITAVSFNKTSKKVIAKNNTQEVQEIKMVNTAA